jgi:hypothetical protein
MAYSLRLPENLDQAARARALQIGVPYNALICFALDQYMRGGAPAAVPGSPVGVVIDELDLRNPNRVSLGGTPLAAKSLEGLTAKLGHKPPKGDLERNGIKASGRLAPIAPPPPLTGKTTKAQRRAFTALERAFKKSQGTLDLG